MNEKSIVDEIKDFFDSRAALGIEKYGTTLDENNEDDFTQHLIEELADAMQYLIKRRRMFEEGELIAIRRKDMLEVIDLLDRLTQTLKRFYYE